MQVDESEQKRSYKLSVDDFVAIGKEVDEIFRRRNIPVEISIKLLRHIVKIAVANHQISDDEPYLMPDPAAVN